MDLGVGALDVLRQTAAGAAALATHGVAKGAVELRVVVEPLLVGRELLLQVRESWARDGAGGRVTGDADGWIASCELILRCAQLFGAVRSSLGNQTRLVGIRHC